MTTKHIEELRNNKTVNTDTSPSFAVFKITVTAVSQFALPSYGIHRYLPPGCQYPENPTPQGPFTPFKPYAIHEEFYKFNLTSMDFTTEDLKDNLDSVLETIKATYMNVLTNQVPYISKLVCVNVSLVTIKDW